VVPHAGYFFSGAVAAAAFATLLSQARALRVALLGPSHFTPLRGVAIYGGGRNLMLAAVSVQLTRVINRSTSATTTRGEHL
jgi:AmmeMemoRadiSam system protein B